MGQDFVDTVQKLFRRVDKISIESVLIEMTKSGLNTIPLEFRDDLLERNPAVKSVIDLGYVKDDVEAMAGNLKASDSLGDSSEINRYFRQGIMCRLCREKEISIVFLPCGHFVCCVDCSLILAGCPCGLDIKGLTLFCNDFVYHTENYLLLKVFNMLT
ncbi:Death-associated inhibitor of apoptosis 2 [Bulinus truncatus]|nr:Death-associated inhibitor of apoptosis 2 [Bulinus truncatus]